MKLFQWEISTKKFIAIVSTAVVLLASGITIPIVAINSGKDKGNAPTPHTHVPTKIEYVAPDCDTAGNNQYYFCDGCDKYFKDEECKTETTVSAEQIEKTGHTGGEAACGEKAVCMNCGEPYGEVGEHSYGEASYAWSTENTICTATRVCSKDESHVETENGKINSSVAKAATCEEMGETTYVATFTNTAFATQSKTVTDIAIDDKNHKEGEVKYVWNGNNTECTATQYCERNVAHVIYTETATASVEQTGDCSTGITTTYTATFTNTAFETQTKAETISVEELEHTYGDPIVEWNADYTDCTVTRVCSTGNHTDTLTRKIEMASDGAKTVTAYDGKGAKIAFFVYKQKTSGDGYYLYQSEIERANSIQVKTYDEAGNCTSEGYRLIFEGYAPDSDDSEFGEP